MYYNRVKQKLKNLYNDELRNIIIKCKGSYIVYNRYKVTNCNGIWNVYRGYDFIHGFATSSTAISWCLADKSTLVEVCISLIDNDSKLQRRKYSILVNKEILKIKESVHLRDRISYDLSIIQSIKNELKETINKTKYIQLKGFIKNATKRPNTSNNSFSN